MDTTERAIRAQVIARELRQARELSARLDAWFADEMTFGRK